MDEFVIWESEYNEGSCVIGNPAGFEDQFLLMEGVPLLKQWPENVACEMSPQYPKDIRLTDNLYGCDYPVVSQRLKEQIAVLAGAGEVEFLPVSILNHKGRVASKDYFMLNPVGNVDCIDTEKSGAKWNAIDTTVISHFKRLVLKADAVPAGVGVFRPTHRTRTILLRRQVADRLSSDGFTGLCFTEPARYRG
jgi:hypothetical protein